MTKLLIAEKPSVAREVASLVGATNRHDGYLEGRGWMITWCFGHLVSQKMPEDINPSWKDWKMETLPMLPEDIGLVPRTSKGVEEQIEVIKDLLQRQDVTQIINACDAGREGEHIFRSITAYLGVSSHDPRLYRLWTSSLTETALRAALADIKPASRWDSLGEAARARSEADWLVGLNATRALTCKAREAGYGGGVLSVGRVQTPTLAIVVERDQQRESFESHKFYEVLVHLFAAQPESAKVSYVGRWVNAQGLSRLETHEQASQVVERLKQQVSGVIDELVRKQERVGAPRLFDLTSLQREANKRYGLTAQQTLDAAQALYEGKHLTYPRTDSRAVGDDMAPGFAAMCAALERLKEMAQVSEAAVSAQLTLATHLLRHVKPEEVSDHHAILPTVELPTRERLSKEQAQVYELVVRRTLAALLNDGVDEVARVHTSLGQERLVTTTRGRLEQGWRLVWEAGADSSKKAVRANKAADAEVDEEDSGALPGAFVQGSKVLRERVILREGKTQPPAAYTEATLLGAMEHALKGVLDDAEMEQGEAAPEGGLGTPATRASILETLVARSYLAREGKSVVSTQLGRQVIAALPQGQLTNATWTAKWEQALSRIERGTLSADVFMNKVRAFTQTIVGQLSQSKGFSFTDMTAVSTCPVCKAGSIKRFEKGWSCNNRAACKFTLWGNVAGKDLTDSQVRDLLDGKKTRIIKGFTSKSGKLFDACLKLKEDGKIEFIFDSKTDQATKRK